jgi:hypothetical protein
MANINDKKREAELHNVLKEGIVVALHVQGKSYQGIAGIVDDSYSYVSRIVVRDIELAKRFNPEIVEKIMEAARKISDNKTYCVELVRLAEDAKQKVHNGPIISTEAIDIFYRKTYAETLASIWEKFTHNLPANIFKYQPMVVAAKTTLDGKMFVLPKEILPVQIRETHSSKRPYLALGFEAGELEMCDENAGQLTIPVQSICKTYSTTKKKFKGKIPPLESLAREQVRILCVDYFKRNNYDFGRDLRDQIDKRVLEQIAPVALKKRIQLAGNGLYRNS